MLQTPTLINALREDPLPDSSQVWGVVHAFFYSLRSKDTDQRCEKRGAGGFWVLPSAPNGIC